jgi:hypothetical protein
MKPSALFLVTGAAAAIASLILTVALRAAQEPTLEAASLYLRYFGWPSLLVFGLYYQVTAHYDEGLARLQYRIEAANLIGFLSGLYGGVLGYSSFEPLSVICPLLGTASISLFAWNVLSTTMTGRPTSPKLRPGPAAGVEPSGASASWRRRANIS